MSALLVSARASRQDLDHAPLNDRVWATTRELPLIGAVQQVRHLKDRGGRFELRDEQKAERFLRESNFFFKVKTFAKCFSRYTNPGSERFGSHINPDFAYLAELTRLDHHLRETVLSLTLDIELYMKVELSRMIMDTGDGPCELMAFFFGSEQLDAIFNHAERYYKRMPARRGAAGAMHGRPRQSEAT